MCCSMVHYLVKNLVQEHKVRRWCRLQTIKCGWRGLTSWRPVCCLPSSASNSTLTMWTVITVHSLNVHCQMTIVCNVNITVCTWRVEQEADAPRDTSEGKSHGSWDPEVPPPLSLRKYPATRGGGRTLTKLGQDPTGLGDNGGAFPDLR